MSTIIGTERGLRAMAGKPASYGIINGVRIEAVALAVSGKPSPDMSDDEEAIAKYVRRVGDKLERKGWLPDLRRRRMLDCIVREAVRCSPPAVAQNESENARPGA